MAESITEGTLKQFSKRMHTQPSGPKKTCFSPRNIDNSFSEVGDYVERDEEIATIETDKVDLFSNITLCSRSIESNRNPLRTRSMFP